MSSIGHMDVYRCGDDLDDYVERLEQYFIANEIGSLAAGVDDTAEARESAQRKKVATFLTLVGPEAYRLLKSLLSPAIPASKTFPELIEVLGNHLKPKKLIVAERFRFHQRNQNEGETVAQFEAAITWVTNVVFVTPYVMRVDVQDTSKGHAEKRGQCQQM